MRSSDRPYAIVVEDEYGEERRGVEARAQSGQAAVPKAIMAQIQGHELRGVHHSKRDVPRAWCTKLIVRSIDDQQEWRGGEGVKEGRCALTPTAKSILADTKAGQACGLLEYEIEFTF